MDPALVRCRSCEREWHSATLADGLRAVGKCPRCGGELQWAEGQDAAPRAEKPAGQADVAPHLVLGVPRR